MLKIKNIFKSYNTAGFSQVALNDVSIEFREKEFVAILGHSGSGKTTCLNIIGGLDRYDSGDIIINGKSTKNFSDSDWDAYRNNSIGFVFQSYNLISHLNIIDNIELGLTLSGIPKEKRRKKSIELLEKVGLKEHMKKKPGQLSGGQMQRVAIARALANDPDIILADEPTGALDSATSFQIMDLIKDIAREKLVIMVTHNSDIAEKYADRVIRFSDGKVASDSNPPAEHETKSGYKLKKTAMTFFNALKLSGRNISTKKWRTILTSFASSIGIIGIALILSLSTGFQNKINEFEADALSEFPIVIQKEVANIDQEKMNERQQTALEMFTGTKEYVDSDEVFLVDAESRNITHSNNLSNEFIDYVKKINPEICSSIGYTYLASMNVLRKVDNSILPVSFSAGVKNQQKNSISAQSMDSAGLSSYPTVIRPGMPSYLESNYDLLAGSYPSSDTDLVLVVDTKNRVDTEALERLGFNTKNNESIKFSQIVGTQFKLVSNNDYYKKTEMGSYLPSQDYQSMYDLPNNINVKISGIVRLKKDVKVGILGYGIAYSDDLVQRVLKDSLNSDIVKAQKESDKDITTLIPFNTEDEKELILMTLGGTQDPYVVYMYPSNFDQKDAVLNYLDEYNKGKSKKDAIIYTDLAKTISDLSTSILDGITVVLVAFAMISLVVSLIMIGIITYISVLERTREIGVLRALGARKKDISRVFNAETFIIGTISGLLGIGIAYMLTIPINSILYNLTSLEGIAVLNPLYAFGLVALSVSLTLLGGSIPARIAAKKDPVEALRSE